MAYHLEYDANGKLLISGIECACGCAHTLPSQDIYVGANLIARIPGYIRARAGHALRAGCRQ